MTATTRFGHLGGGLLTATGMLGAAATPGTARGAALTATATRGTLGVVGLALAGSGGNPLALDAWGNGLHLVLAIWGMTATLRTDQTRTDDGDGAVMRSHP